MVLACSLLKRSYRETVIDNHQGDVKLVYLQAARSLLEQRLTSRLVFCRNQSSR